LEAVALVGDGDPTEAELALIKEIAGRPVAVWVAGPDGGVRTRLEA
jgi:hypothetical protein